MKYRFPPSPTGSLHVGNVRTALDNWLLARKNDAAMVLRIEDTDVARSTRENEDGLIADLKWLRIDWDEGPEVGGDCGPYRQSERLETYQGYIDTLLKNGDAYYCFCTAEELDVERKKAQAEKRPPRYNGKCRDLDAAEVAKRRAGGEDAAIRFKVADGEPIQWQDLVHGDSSFQREDIGDFLFVRSDGMPVYNFVVTVDDALMEITHIMRGDDHLSNTPRQILLYNALGFDLPTFGHLPMILGPDGSRLSKRHGATSVSQFREAGYLPDALINFLALLGWNPGTEQEIFTREELIAAFSADRISKGAAIFNFEKLDWMNGQYMRAAAPADLLPHLESFLSAKGLLPEKMTDELSAWYEKLIECFNSGSLLTEIADGAEMAFDFDAVRDLATEEAKEILAEETAKTVISTIISKLAELPADEELDGASFKVLVKSVQKETGIKGKNLFHPVRLAISGKTSGPELGKLVPLLEQGEKLALPKPVIGVRARLAATAKALEIS